MDLFTYVFCAGTHVKEQKKVSIKANTKDVSIRKQHELIGEDLLSKTANVGIYTIYT